MTATARKPRQRTRIDWSAARTAYIALDATQRSFARIARDFRVSSVTVRKHAHRDGWVEAAEQADREVARQANRLVVKSRAERVATTLSVVDGLLDHAVDDLPRLGRDLKPGDLPGIVKLAELLEGEATDRVAVGEVQLLVKGLIAYTGRFLPPASRAEFLEGLPAVVGELGGGS